MEVLQIYWGRESCCLVLVYGLSSSLVLARVRALLDYVRTTAAAEVLRARYPHLSPCCIVMPQESPTRSEIEQRSLARPCLQRRLANTRHVPLWLVFLLDYTCSHAPRREHEN